MTKINKKRKIKYGVIAVIIIFAMIAPGVYKFIDIPSGGKRKEDNILGSSSFLSEVDVDEPSYSFYAWNESYIVCRVHNAPYANFTLDGQVYNVSYGMNYIPINFLVNKSYLLTFEEEDISADVFDWFVVEPLLIDYGYVEVNPVTPTEINFNAAGLVSFFIRWNHTKQNDFTYDDLYIEYDGTAINEIRGDWDDTFDVDPLIVSLFRFDGSYIQYDIFMKPGDHTIELKGNGTICYKLVVSGDWDKDGISNAEEVQKAYKSPFYDPFNPLAWGFFEKGSNYRWILDPEDEYGVFSFSIPESLESQFLSIELISGSIKNVEVDSDSFTFQGKEFYSSFFDNSKVIHYGMVSTGEHFIRYDYTEDCVIFIKFYLNGVEIVQFSEDELMDKDCDGLPDSQEQFSGTDKLSGDTDGDNLLDG